MNPPASTSNESTHAREGDAAIAPGKIAVIAVHGVGDQVPFAMARSIARLLQRRALPTSAAATPYSGFTEVALDIPISEWSAYVDRAGANAGDGFDEHIRGRAFGANAWYVRSDFVKQGTIRGNETADTAFTRRALETARIADDQPERKHYGTVCVSGTRGTGTDAKAVDIYELYWADLAKKTGGIAQILAKFYQLLFHLSFLGVKTVEWAWAQQTDVRVKRRLRNVLTTQAVVDALLGGVTPVLNIVLAAMILPVLALRFPGERWVLALSLIAGAIAAGAGYYAARNKVNRARASPESSSSPALLLVPLVLAVVVALGIYLGLAEVSDPYRYALAGLYVLAQVACVALVVWITAKLADRRAASPFSAAGGTDARSWLNSVPRASLLPTLAAGAGFWWAGWHYQTAADGSLSSQLLLTVTHAAEAFLMLVNACWIVLMIAAAAMCVAGWWCLRIVPAADKATRRAIWTGKMGFLVSASLFSLVTLIAWAALVHVLKPAIPADVVYVEWLPVFGGCADATLLCKIALLNDTVGGAGYNVFLVVLFLAAAALVIAFLPSVLLESAPVLDRNANRSAALGHWLDLGLASLRIVGYALLTSLIVVVPALGVAAAFHLGFFARDYDLHGIWSSSLVAYAAGALIAPLALMVSIRTNLFGGFQRAVNIALDVDNWLSERPAENNPRGHILLRYLGLLRHIEAQGYRDVVFVTHSQGTVITADLLRFLQAAPTAATQVFVDWTKRLLTAGSPLRQLYSLRFPHWYGWCREEDSGGGDAPSPLPPPLPSAIAMGVERWFNAYRSGDYVGRYLWWRERDRKGPWAPLTITATNDRCEELCLERGAHTHYFDGSSEEVAVVIDRLVV